jgi:ribosomal protein S18 acetylase RimI-like enzyme
MPAKPAARSPRKAGTKVGDGEASANGEALKRERAGTYRTGDGRFTVEQSSSGWLVLDAEQTDDLGLPLARGPFPTLDAAKAAMAGARTSAAPTSELRAPGAAKPKAAGKKDGESTRTAKPPRRAPKRPDPEAVIIREYRTVDGDALRALWRACGFRSLGDDDLGLARLARRNPGLVLVAAEAGRVIGSALGGWDGRRATIYHVAVAESHRRRGIATRLVDRVESGLRDLGSPEVRVNVTEDNDAARAFWKARGYQLRPIRQLARALRET